MKLNTNCLALVNELLCALITHMASKIFTFEEKLKMYVEEVWNNDFSSFLKFDLIENNVFSNETNIETLKPQFLEYFTKRNEQSFQ